MGKRQSPRARKGNGGGRVGLRPKKGASKGAESQLSAVEFRPAGAGFRVSLPGNWFLHKVWGTDLQFVSLNLNSCPTHL